VTVDGPAISVVIPTRDRPTLIAACVARVLASTDVGFDVTVVDQSDDDATTEALAEFGGDSRLRLIRTETRGVGAGRNVGVHATTGELVLFTDDDCLVEPTWAAGVASQFRRTPEVGVLYAPVVLPDDRPEGSFAAAFAPVDVTYRGRLPGPRDPWGISANMAVRRVVFDRVGDFDEALGAGATFPSGAETDFTIRAVAAGELVRHATEPSVLHVGLREGSRASTIVRRYGLGMGAVFMKHLRLWSRPGRSLLLRWLVIQGAGGLRNLVLRRRPTGLGLTSSIALGALRSARTPIDRRRGCYVIDAARREAPRAGSWDAADGPGRGPAPAD
jgi:GT2 family glycosyltransferase